MLKWCLVSYNYILYNVSFRDAYSEFTRWLHLFSHTLTHLCLFHTNRYYLRIQNQAKYWRHRSQKYQFYDIFLIIFCEVFLSTEQHWIFFTLERNEFWRFYFFFYFIPIKNCIPLKWLHIHMIFGRRNMVLKT